MQAPKELVLVLRREHFGRIPNRPAYADSRFYNMSRVQGSVF
jgi:hypothetical protein